jgi:hypothetical protein
MRLLTAAPLVVAFVVADGAPDAHDHQTASASRATTAAVRSAADRPETPSRITELTPELRGSILTAMRFNRRAFHEESVLARYDEDRLPPDDPALVSCDLPRTPSGEPASQYPAPEARATPRVYTEAAIVDCLETTGGLAGTRANPLAQHYYCSLPGVSPDIRACFTFQLRLPRVSRKRSIVDEDGYLPDGKKAELLKGWNFLGPDPSQVPDAGAAFNYCLTDGRPHSIKSKRGEHEVATIHPAPTRPMCWIAKTQLEIFQGIMGGGIDPPLDDQIALLREYYECDRIKGKVSARRFRAMCEIDVSEFR